MTTNCVRYEPDDIARSRGVGSMSTLTVDLDITVEPLESDNPMAPTHRVLGRSPKGHLVKCGGIWRKRNRETGADYLTLTIRDYGFNANLGKAAQQDDAALQAVIPLGVARSRLILGVGWFCWPTPTASAGFARVQNG